MGPDREAVILDKALKAEPSITILETGARVDFFGLLIIRRIRLRLRTVWCPWVIRSRNNLSDWEYSLDGSSTLTYRSDRRSVPSDTLPFLSTYLPEGNRDAKLLPHLGNQIHPFSERYILLIRLSPLLLSHILLLLSSSSLLSLFSCEGNSRMAIRFYQRT